MILILSDGSSLAADVQGQLDLHREEYILFFTDFKAAGRLGRGGVIIGIETEASVAAAIRDNGITAVIDAVAEPMSALSAAAQAACNKDRVFYIKYVKTEEVSGAKLCLSYSHIADMVRGCRQNVLFYAEPRTVSAVASLVGEEHKSKMYVPLLKSAVFDAEAALEYSIPLLNIVETEWLWGEEAVSSMLEKTGASLIVCDMAEGISDKIAAAKAKNIKVILTHSMGIDFKRAAATARDAVIALHQNNK